MANAALLIVLPENQPARVLLEIMLPLHRPTHVNIQGLGLHSFLIRECKL